jgi:hypothetical protein
MLRKHSTPLTWLVSLSLLICLCASLFTPDSSRAQSAPTFSTNRKLSVDLLAQQRQSARGHAATGEIRRSR